LTTHALYVRVVVVRKIKICRRQQVHSMRAYAFMSASDKVTPAEGDVEDDYNACACI